MKRSQEKTSLTSFSERFIMANRIVAITLIASISFSCATAHNPEGGFLRQLFPKTWEKINGPQQKETKSNGAGQGEAAKEKAAPRQQKKGDQAPVIQGPLTQTETKNEQQKHAEKTREGLEILLVTYAIDIISMDDEGRKEGIRNVNLWARNLFVDESTEGKNMWFARLRNDAAKKREIRLWEHVEASCLEKKEDATEESQIKRLEAAAEFARIYQSSLKKGTIRAQQA